MWDKQERSRGGLPVREKRMMFMIAVLACVAGGLWFPARALAQSDALAVLIQKYNAYQENFAAIENVEDVEERGYEIIEDQSFPVILESFGEEEVMFLPILEKTYHRLAVLIADQEGRVLYKTNQLEANYKYLEQLEQPVTGVAAVSFKDLNHDGLTDIVLLADCENTTGDYAGNSYKIGDVLFQKEGEFYRDWRISDKINRFSMNKSADFIAAYVRDGSSTEILYTATTLDELLENGFQIIEEQCYKVNFEKQGKLQVVPGILRIAVYDVFMIYLVNDQGSIVWSFQPMGDYDNLYALKGITCKDLDGDGMKDILVMAVYSYAGADGELLTDVRCSVYYQRTDRFTVDLDFCESYHGTEEDKVSGLVETIRQYWGWTKEE